MEKYKDINGDSGVEAYYIGEDFLEVNFFSTEKTYKYSYQSAGVENVKLMKNLAKSGDGLNSFINKHVRKMYEK